MEQEFGPEDGREAVVRQYSDLVYRLALAQVHRRADAEGVYQEVFLRYFRADPAFSSEEHRKAWLIRVTVNCAKKFWSSAWIRHTVPLEEDLAFEQEADNRLWEELQNLPGKYRAVLHLFYYEELSAEEIGGLLGLQPSAVRMRLTRGRRMLRQRLEE